jgi:putative transcriptional regulator
MINARKTVGLTRVEAARKAGVSTASWVSYETGQRRPSLTVAFKIARLLNKPVDDLFICP